MLAHHVVVSPKPFPVGSYPDRDLRLSAVILTALRKRPEHRYATMDALGLDLDRLMGRRSDPLEAPRSIERDDIYLPENPYGRMALRKFYSVLKLPHP
jgi:serine/threonine-protein kinase